MNFLENKKILIGITGGIAAYKIPSLVRRFVQLGAEVKIIFTESASHFLQPELFGYLTGHPTYTSTFVEDNRFSTYHIDFQKWADLFLIAPASANILAKLRGGIADDLLTTTALSVKCPLLVCPAMNSTMLYHPAVQDNIQTLKKRKVFFVEPDSGELLCNTEGKGRLPSEERIILETEKILAPQLDFLKDKSVLVTLGSSREYLDPIRFISNGSSGKMGLAIAESCYLMGSRSITVIKGESSPAPIFPATVVNCQDTKGFFQVYKAHHKNTDIAFFTAALADFTPEKQELSKIKKGGRSSLSLTLNRTDDIALWAGKNKKKSQILIGFAAEDNDVEKNSREKLSQKHLDAIILNVVSAKNPAFSASCNEVHVLFPDGTSQFIEKQSKKFLARKIMLKLGTYFKSNYLTLRGVNNDSK